MTECPDTGAPPWLNALPRLPRLELLGVSYGIGHEHCVGNELRHVALLPRLKSLRLDATSVTPAGIAELAPLASLEELAVNRRVVSAPGVHSLLAITGLKNLALSPYPLSGKIRRLTLDDGAFLSVEVTDFDDFDCALRRLRKARPDLVVSGFPSKVFRESRREFSSYGYNSDTDPAVHVKWLPTKDRSWMTPEQRIEFEQAGGWASFAGAGLPSPESRGDVSF